MLIDREAAIDKVEQLRQAYLECHERRQKDGLDVLARANWHSAEALGQALTLLQALPAIGTCADCAEWSKRGCSGVCRRHGIQIHTMYEGREIATWHFLTTEPAHFCAAWRAKA